jgi:hypothetical protein
VYSFAKIWDVLKRLNLIFRTFNITAQLLLVSIVNCALLKIGCTNIRIALKKKDQCVDVTMFKRKSKKLKKHSKKPWSKMNIIVLIKLWRTVKASTLM